MDKNDNIEQLASKLLAGNISEKELEILNSWYATEGSDKALQPEGAKEVVKARMIQRLQENINTTPSRTTPLRREGQRVGQFPPIKGGKGGVIRRPWLVAASIAIIATLGIWLYTNNLNTPPDSYRELQHPNTVMQVTTESGQRKTLTLPDGTKVWLNTNSTLEYPEKFNGNMRTLTLTGEAYFDVAQDENKPFILHTAHLITTVLGTSFNARALPNAPTEITVTTGKVKVATQKTSPDNSRKLPKAPDSYRDGTGREPQHQLLTPGQQVVFNNGNFTRHQVDTTPYTVWIQKKIVFEATPLATAALMLERYYGVAITIKDKKLKQATLMGVHEGKSLESVLKAMQHVIGFNYEFIDEKNVEITNIKP